MFHREILEEAEKILREKRQKEESAAMKRARDAEEKDPELRRLGEEKRAFGARVLSESLKGGEDLRERVEKLKTEHEATRRRYEDRLVKMGLPRDHTATKVSCALCGDTGYYQGKMCTCLKKEVVLGEIRASGIAHLLEKQTFANFDLSFYSATPLPEKRYSPRDVMREIYDFCRDYAENFSLSSPSLLFMGGTGLGKTHLSRAIAGEVIRRGYDVLYESAPAVAATFEKERFESEEEAGGTRRLLEAELLILDDLGTEAPSRATSSAIYRLINYRVAVKGLPTIISTNLSSRQLEKNYDSAVVSRLFGDFCVKFFQGSDVRMAKLKR